MKYKPFVMRNKSFVRKNEIEDIRNSEEIPKDFKAFIHIDDFIWGTLAMQIKPKVNYSDLILSPEHISIDDDYGIIKGKDFVLVKYMSQQKRDEEILLFAKDYKKFHQKYIFKKPIKRKETIYGCGFYRPSYHALFGWILEPVKVGKIAEPILNDNLFKILSDEIKAFMEKRKVYDDVGIEYKRGILLMGGAGNGKTSFIKYLLKEHKEKAIGILCEKNDVNQLDFLGGFLSNNKYKDILKIVVLEDIDGMKPNHRSLLLNFLDGIIPTPKTIFIATTNFPERLDIAIKNRPSRFDSVHVIEKPNKASRKQFLESFFKNINGKEMQLCVEESEGFSGAYFKEIYIFSKLNDLTPLQAIKELKKRFSIFGEYVPTSTREDGKR